jgi:hypothetical protein
MTSMISPDGDFSGSRDWEPPFAGFQYFNFFRGGEANVARNLAKGGAPAMKRGTPTYGDGYARFTAMSNFLDTMIADGLEKTLISAGRGVGSGTGTTRSMFISSYAANNLLGRGASIFGFGPVTTQYTASLNDGATGAAAVGQEEGNDPNAWGIRSLRIFLPSSGNQGRLIANNLTTGWTSGEVAFAYPRQPAAQAFRVGSSWSIGFLGVSDHVADAIISRGISDAELATMAALMRAVAARDGITL